MLYFFRNIFRYPKTLAVIRAYNNNNNKNTGISAQITGGKIHASHIGIFVGYQRHQVYTGNLPAVVGTDTEEGERCALHVMTSATMMMTWGWNFCTLFETKIRWFADHRKDGTQLYHPRFCVFRGALNLIRSSWSKLTCRPDTLPDADHSFDSKRALTYWDLKVLMSFEPLNSDMCKASFHCFCQCFHC